MNSLNLSDLIRVIMAVIGLSIAYGKFYVVRDFALREGIKAVTLHGYKPLHFFPAPSSR